MDTSKNELMVTIRCLTYNHEPYIRQCLEGFVMQKTNFRFEAIVHDDASTDGTVAIIKEYAEKYPDIIKPIFETENQYSKRDGSIKRIMNEHTHGKYIAFCEGDDYWIDPLKLQKQVDFLEKNPEYVLTCHRYEIFDEEKNIFHHTDGYDFLFENKDGISFDYSMKYWITKTLSLVFRRDALTEYNKYNGINRDTVLNYFLLKEGLGYCFNEVMGVYRLNNGGVFGKQPLYKRAKDAYLVAGQLYQYEKNKKTRYRYYSCYARLVLVTKGKFIFTEPFDFWKNICLPYFFIVKIYNSIVCKKKKVNSL